MTKLSLNKRSAAVAAVASLVLSACGGGSGGSSDGAGSTAGPAGDPVAGGTGRILVLSEPRSLQPAIVGNVWGGTPIVGNALYGQLMIDDSKTGDIEYRIAKSFATDDGGKTFTLSLRDDITFSDGTPLTADDVKATWDHAKDPATASNDLPQVSSIESVQVVDPATVKLTLVSRIPTFAHSVIQTGLNWITSEEAIAGGIQGMDTSPVGAGPYVLEKFARQDVIRLKRNDGYYDEGKPYLDTLEVRAMQDPEQRYNTMSTNGADLALEGQALNIDRSKKAGLQTNVLDWGGGSNFVMNTTRAPFDDVRARQAFAAAIDFAQIDDALNQGTGSVPTTLFPKSSPFYEDIALTTKDPAKVQKLLDELAADGKQLSFTLSVFPGSGAALGNSIQTQLATFKNVDVKIKTIEIATYGQTMGTKDYDMITNSVNFGPEPEPRLWAGLHSASGGNYTGFVDPVLDGALDEALTSPDAAERKAAYKTVQERLVETVPMVFWSGSVIGVVSGAKVGGVQQYGAGSVLPETLWIAP